MLGRVEDSEDEPRHLLDAKMVELAVDFIYTFKGPEGCPNFLRVRGPPNGPCGVRISNVDKDPTVMFGNGWQKPLRL